MSLEGEKVLFYAIGNPARGDDGLGMALLERVPDRPGWERVHNFQLNIEDAANIQGYQKVFFLDAAIDLTVPYEVIPIKAKSGYAFSSHSQDVPSVLAIAEELYGVQECEYYLVKVLGHQFELGMEISEQSQRNLDECFKHFDKHFLC